jgi:glyceraldehyde-3-phosphate dehydrogenase/erythrose-4-phosphate dehydrogenase
VPEVLAYATWFRSHSSDVAVLSTTLFTVTLILSPSTMSSPPKNPTTVPATTTEAPTSPPAPPITAPAPAPPAITPHANPKVAELQAMFPTVEVSVIELVLETCGGSTDRSIEQLLSMTDDNFKPDELESVRREEAVSCTIFNETELIIVSSGFG